MPELFEIYVVYKRRYINTLPFLFYETVAVLLGPELPSYSFQLERPAVFRRRSLQRRRRKLTKRPTGCADALNTIVNDGCHAQASRCRFWTSSILYLFSCTQLLNRIRHGKAHCKKKDKAPDEGPGGDAPEAGEVFIFQSLIFDVHVIYWQWHTNISIR